MSRDTFEQSLRNVTHGYKEYICAHALENIFHCYNLIVKGCYLGHLDTGFCVKLVLGICIGKLPVQLPPESCDFFSVLDNVEKVNSSFYIEMFDYSDSEIVRRIADMAVFCISFIF